MIPRTLSLTEYQATTFSASEISNTEGETLWQHWQKKMNVEFPSPKTKGQWILSSQGWVGHLPITPEFGIRIHPRVPLHNLFGMLEYPKRLDHPLDLVIGKIRVRSMTFSLDGNLDDEGRRFLDELLGSSRAA